MTHEIDIGLGGGTLLHLANKDHTQMMGYVIKSDGGEVTVIDGGTHKRPKDAKALYDSIIERGGRVHNWIITHAHSDHIGSLVYILENFKKIEIDMLYFDFPKRDWFEKVNGIGDNFCVDRLYQLIDEFKIPCSKLYKGQIIGKDVKFEILNEGLRNYENYDDANDSGFCIKAYFKNREVLFLGDIGVPAQNELIKDAKDKLRCDIVQLAHHGQNGVDYTLYDIVKPKICLWTTPDWLWYNDKGEGVGSGKWDTLTTRLWMNLLGATEHYISKDGDYLFK